MADWDWMEAGPVDEAAPIPLSAVPEGQYMMRTDTAPLARTLCAEVNHTHCTFHAPLGQVAHYREE